jgi:hypothetical protein
MADNKKMWAWVGAAVVVVVIVLAFVWKPNMNNPKGTTPTPVGTPVYAPQGQLIPQFPTQLILDSAASLNQSYSINYSSTTNHYTAEYNSSSSMASMYTKYKTYLPANGWVIANDMTLYSNSRGLYATNTSSGVEVAIDQIGKGSKVIITYLIK